MPIKKDIVKGGAPVYRIRPNPSPLYTHESVVDFINGRRPGSTMLDVFTSGLFGLHFLRNINRDLEDDIMYSDDDEEDDFYPRDVAHGPLEPHPRIRQLTEEEAEKHARELIEEEERRKDKTERNKRKKLRKKEKKRLEKENAVKEMPVIPVPEDKQWKSVSSENQEENPVIESNKEADEPPEMQNANATVRCDENTGYNNNKEENLTKINKREDEEDLDLNNKYSSMIKSVAEETCNQRPERQIIKERTKLPEVKHSKEEKAKAVEKPAVQKKKEEHHDPNNENRIDPTAIEFAKRSRELAGMGNRFFASGQYEMAVKCFTDAIKYNPQEFKLFGNRSLCYERMQQYENALRDADLALCIEPNWIKGLFRKGKALCGLKRHYEASLIYKQVVELESTSAEATQELKRAQTLHLMEMGFTWAESSEALKTHPTLEEAVESLFGDRNPGDASASGENTDRPMVQEEDDDDKGEWIVQQTNRPRTQQNRVSEASGQSRSKSQSPTPRSRNLVKPQLFSIWVGSLAPAVTYTTLHELFSRAGTVYGIKMLLEHQCAFVNYTKKEDCDRAIQCINGMVVEGAPLSVRYPNKIHARLGMSKTAIADPCSRPGWNRECFFWRTTGCTRPDCTYIHDPKHKNIDKDKFTSRFGNFQL